MALLVNNCSRCKAEEITFDVKHGIGIGAGNNEWQRRYEAFAICRRCHLSTVFILEISDYGRRDTLQGKEAWATGISLNGIVKVVGYVSSKDRLPRQPPDHLPPDIEGVFREGATCLSVGCFNAAGTMFRLCLDMATRELLPVEDDQAVAPPNRKQRRDLGLRLPWLIEHGRLPNSLAQLASVVKEDGNDGAHAGTLGREDAEDLLDFTEVLLERLYTEPARVALAEARRIERRGGT